MIEANGLTKRYGKKLAVDHLSFTIQANKVTGFLGPNGAGKSTTMRLMLGLDSGTGSTIFNGKQLHDYTQPSKMVGILLEAKAFHPTRTARNHLRVLAAAGGVPDKRVDEVLDVVGLSDVARKKPGKFSLGMSQRLGIAAAILSEPEYLMLDEPANGLDPEGMAWLRQFIQDYATKDKGVFVSSHLLSEMSQMADNLVVIGKGKLIADTSISELMARGKGVTVFVRSSKLSVLKRALDSRSMKFEIQNEGLRISGVSTDVVGKLAFEVSVPLLELSSQGASLEQVFLELTEGDEEYVAGSKSKGGTQ